MKKIDPKNMAYAVAHLQQKDHTSFMKEYCLLMKNRPDLLKESSDRINNTLMPYDKIDKWMDKRFDKDLKMTPRRVAGEACRYHMNGNRKMGPLLIKMAQKIKRRVYMRKKKQGKLTPVEKSLYGDCLMVDEDA